MKQLSIGWVTVLLLATVYPATCTGSEDPCETLRARLCDSLWQWDGPGGEQVFFKRNGYIEHVVWTRRGLITRWQAIDRRTVLQQIERA